MLKICNIYSSIKKKTGVDNGFRGVGLKLAAVEIWGRVLSIKMADRLLS